MCIIIESEKRENILHTRVFTFKDKKCATTSHEEKVGTASIEDVYSTTLCEDVPLPTSHEEVVQKTYVVDFVCFKVFIEADDDDYFYGRTFTESNAKDSAYNKDDPNYETFVMKANPEKEELNKKYEQNINHSDKDLEKSLNQIKINEKREDVMFLREEVLPPASDKKTIPSTSLEMNFQTTSNKDNPHYDPVMMAYFDKRLKEYFGTTINKSCDIKKPNKHIKNWLDNDLEETFKQMKNKKENENKCRRRRLLRQVKSIFQMRKSNFMD